MFSCEARKRETASGIILGCALHKHAANVAHVYETRGQAAARIVRETLGHDVDTWITVSWKGHEVAEVSVAGYVVTSPETMTKLAAVLPLAWAREKARFIAALSEGTTTAVPVESEDDPNCAPVAPTEFHGSPGDGIPSDERPFARDLDTPIGVTLSRELAGHWNALDASARADLLAVARCWHELTESGRAAVRRAVHTVLPRVGGEAP